MVVMDDITPYKGTNGYYVVRHNIGDLYRKSIKIRAFWTFDLRDAERLAEE